VRNAGKLDFQHPGFLFNIQNLLAALGYRCCSVFSNPFQPNASVPSTTGNITLMRQCKNIQARAIFSKKGEWGETWGPEHDLDMG